MYLAKEVERILLGSNIDGATVVVGRTRHNEQKVCISFSTSSVYWADRLKKAKKSIDQSLLPFHTRKDGSVLHVWIEEKEHLAWYFIRMVKKTHFIPYFSEMELLLGGLETPLTFIRDLEAA